MAAAAKELNLRVDRRTSREVTVLCDDLPWGPENSLTSLSIHDKSESKMWCITCMGSKWVITRDILVQGPGHQYEVTAQSGKRSFDGYGFQVEATGKVEFRAGHCLEDF